MKKLNSGREPKNLNLPPLLLCIILDAMGMLTFSIPFIGEFADVLWAPVSSMIYMRLFGGKMGLFGGTFSFLEELLPGTDLIPTFTISWYMRKRAIEKSMNGLAIIK